ncbi:TonB-dependent receptor [Methylobacterium sp. J-076]|uniref:TonB-dependent receptor n=1 Tax=Methylobacterium sp. J-076 TaxID=2836655 RepID=UPI001FB9F873|nr:TonB-dependent siderophore receptor [Methylobacterium sp. J-076]MCJ2014358.1 TonB-dependent siderophore receptor [Methylobacterium sp. J-076]
MARSVTAILAATVPMINPSPGRAGPRQGEADAAVTLDALSVEARGPARQAGTGEAGGLPPAFAGGQVARGTRLGLLGNRDFMETPFSAASYTERTIRDTQAVSVGDLLTRTDPSVRASIGSGNRYDALTIRGFRVDNREFALNGLYGLVPDYRINPAPLERVEVLKGPAAFLFGAPIYGSVAGTVNVVTKRAGEEPLNRVTVDYASPARGGAQVDLARRYGDAKQVGVRINGAGFGGDTPIDRTGQRNGVGSLGLDYAGERLRLFADVIYQHDAYDSQTRGGNPVPDLRIPRAPDPRRNMSQDFDFSRADSLTGLGRAEYDLTPDITLFGALGANRFAYDKQENPAFTLLDATGRTRVNSVFQTGDTATLSGEAGVRGRFATGGIRHEVAFTATRLDQDLTLGQTTYANYLSNLYAPVRLASPGRPLAAGTFPLGRSSYNRMTSYGVSDTMTFADGLVELLVGARRQEIDTGNNAPVTGLVTSAYDRSATTPALGLVLRPTEALSLYANTVQGLTALRAPGTAVNSGQAFAPARSRQYEVGAKLDFTTFGATLSAFQITNPAGNVDPLSQIYGVGGTQRNRGFEATLFGEVAPDLRVIAGATLLDARWQRTRGGLYDGNPATGAPRVQATTGLEWDTPFLRGLTALATVVYTGSSYAGTTFTRLPFSKIPDWTSVDLGLRYTTRVGDKPVTLRATVTNAADRHFWIANPNGALILGAPRTVWLSASLDY